MQEEKQITETEQELAENIRAWLAEADVPVGRWAHIFALVAKGKKAIPPHRDKKPLPELPEGLSWPKGDYGESPEGKGEVEGGIVAYLTRKWLLILDAGRRDGKIYVDRRMIADHYPGTIIAIKNYQRLDRITQERKKIPENLVFHTQSKVNDHLLAAGGLNAVTEEPRLGQVVGRRLSRGAKVPGINDQ
jgi:hypothetical protein